ncbi:hypothetical protein ACGF12_13915 [Kitasatospora sp. NPDC048296]|uniref:hypothetical protein n=1 Tax=Kitasatospora sp. NPDC048296 TaxID=3364048 RepID=UPI003713F5C8
MTPPARRRQLYDFSPPAPEPPPSTVRLDDGTVLAKPTPAGPRQLARGDWLLIGRQACQIVDLRWGEGGGRIVRVAGRTPFSVPHAATVQRFDLVTRSISGPGRTAGPPATGDSR